MQCIANALLIGLAGVHQRQAAGTSLIAQLIHSKLYWDRVHIAEQSFAQGQIFQLCSKAGCNITVKPLLADLVGFAGGHIGKYADHTLAAQSQQGNDLIIVAGIDIQRITA